MSASLFKTIIVAAAGIFVLVFVAVVVPAVLADRDLPGAFAAGFDNPYASGYSSDVLACGVILAAWIVYEARAYGLKHGWVCIALCIVPGVAVGLALYLLMRMRQLDGRAGAGIPAGR